MMNKLYTLNIFSYLYITYTSGKPLKRFRDLGLTLGQTQFDCHCFCLEGD